MWELIATAAAGLNAGAGLQAAIAGGPSAGDAGFASFAGRSRLINLMLTTISTAAAVSTWYEEGRGQLWLYAGIATFLGVPFNLLMMSPPTPFLQPPQPPMAARLQPYAQHKQELAAAEGGHGYETIPEEASTGSGGGTPFAEGVAGYGEEGRAGGGYLPMGRPASPDAPRRRLMYAKSGMLVSPETFSGSWTRRFWFSACLSCLSCGVMLALLATRKDAATYTDTPF